MALYPGSFDPVHLGHLDVARRAAALFDHLIVGVYARPAKPTLFSVEERVELFQAGMSDHANVTVQPYSGLTVDFARASGAVVLVRGLRAVSDLDHEYQLYALNRHLAPSVDTIVILTAPNYAHLSATLIKEIAAQGGPLQGLVPDHVARALRAKLGRAG